MSKIVLDIPEISCEHCAQTITKALQPRPGVRSVHVDVPGQKVHLDYDEGKISVEQVKEILTEEEYPVAAVNQA